MSGAHPWTTISEMELVAAVQALRSVEGRARIELHSDSEYLIYGMRAFVSRWQRQGWRNRRGTQLQHRELWTVLIELNTSLPIRWKWIKGHSGHRDQSRADELAYEAARSLCVRQNLAAQYRRRIQNVQAGETQMASIAETSSLFEIDVELDGLLEEIEGQVESEGQAAEDLVARFQQFCEAHGEKVDRIGRFVRIMEAREQYCRSEAARLTDRARAAAGKVERTKNMVLYYLLSRDLKKIEGHQFTLRAQKNSQDSVRITDEAAVPKSYCRIDARIDGVVWETVLSLLPDELSKSLESSVQETRPNTDAIKAAVMQNEVVPGAEVRRGFHLRVA
jgi:ribonuclease HI